MAVHNELQLKLWEWEQKNFDTSNSMELMTQLAMGMCEEVGELHHALLKFKQKIRESASDFEGVRAQELMLDAIADCFIFGINLLSILDVDVVDLVASTAMKVMQRDWKKYPIDGRTK